MPRARQQGLAAVVSSGDRRKSLEALRDHLARELEAAPPGVAIAPIAKELRNVIEELESLAGGREESKLDDLAAARARRRSAASS